MSKERTIAILEMNNLILDYFGDKVSQKERDELITQVEINRVEIKLLQLGE